MKKTEKKQSWLKMMADFLHEKTENAMDRIGVCVAGLRTQAAAFACEESGMGTVEVILIIVVLIGLVIIFKGQLTQIVNNLFSKISSQASSI